MDANKTGNELYTERLNRVEQAIQVQVPDRVPVFVDFGYLVARYSGLSYEEVAYSPEKLAAANKKIVTDFEPDIFLLINVLAAGDIFESIDTKMIKWPGHGVPPNATHQYIEGEYMKADEYDLLIQSPGDFIIRTYLPRAAGAYAPLQKLPPLISLIGLALGNPVAFLFYSPDLVTTCQSVYTAAKAAFKWETTRMALVEELESLGYPSVYMLGAAPPFDIISDLLRGMRGSMLDMYRQPHQLLAAMDKILPFILQAIRTMPKREGKNTLVFLGPHRGADGFMSLKQFETFYWPGLKATIMAFIEAGFTPYVLWEGDWTSRLPYFLELPKGKILHRFDKTKMVKAKEVLGGHHCIAGGMMPGILQTGTIQQVKDECKRLIDTIGRDGGYIMSTSVQMDEAKPENVRAMIDFTRQYGKYK